MKGKMARSKIASNKGALAEHRTKSKDSKMDSYIFQAMLLELKKHKKIPEPPLDLAAAGLMHVKAYDNFMQKMMEVLRETTPDLRGPTKLKVVATIFQDLSPQERAMWAGKP